jgi:hypothetical protein
MKNILRAGIFCIACMTNFSVSATEWRKEMPMAKLIGSGEFTWWGLSIYTAKLWQETSSFNPQEKFSLEITYHKTISRDRFVETSIDEIKRLHGSKFSPETLAQWRLHMQKSFTDVKSGDQLIGVSVPNYGCRFYSNKKLIAEIPDEKFAAAFFSIWLDTRSKDSDLRRHLLGQEK